MNYDVVIVGNGILGTTLAYLLSKENVSVALIGPKSRRGSASLAAAAMLNVYAEVDGTTLRTEASRLKFDLAVAATGMWPEHLKQLNEQEGSILPVKVKYGTHVIFNRSSDDQARYDQIKEALARHEEKYTEDAPVEGYHPEYEHKAYKSIYLPNEGFINPYRLMDSLDRVISRCPNITVVHAEPLIVEGLEVKAHNDVIARGSKVVIAAGAYSEAILRNGFWKYGMLPMFYGSGSGILVGGEFDQKEAIRTPVRAMSCGLFAVPQYLGGLYIGASSFVRRTPDQQPRTSTVMALLQQASQQINKNLVDSSFLHVTLGHRPITADGFPFIGQVYDNLYMLTGTKRDGLHMSPLYAKDMVERLMDRTPLFDDTFNPTRKFIETISIQEGVDAYATAKCNRMYVHGTRMPDADWERLKKQYRDEAWKKYDYAFKSHKINYGLDPGVLEAW